MAADSTWAGARLDMQLRFQLRPAHRARFACGFFGLVLAGCDGSGGEAIAKAVFAVRELFAPPAAEEPVRVVVDDARDASGSRPEPALPDAASAAAEAAQAGARTMDSIAPEDSIRVYYQFIDDRGRVRFVDRLADVPAAWRDRVGYVEMSSPPPLTPAEAHKTRQADPKVVRQRTIELASNSNEHNPNHGPSLILYSADWCGYCKLAKRHLDGAGYDYEERDVDRPAIAQELREKTGRGGVPVLDAEGEILRGYRKDQYDRFLRDL